MQTVSTGIDSIWFLVEFVSDIVILILYLFSLYVFFLQYPDYSKSQWMKRKFKLNVKYYVFEKTLIRRSEPLKPSYLNQNKSKTVIV